MNKIQLSGNRWTVVNSKTGQVTTCHNYATALAISKARNKATAAAPKAKRKLTRSPF
tara:strand:- start:81 stop:251 length:171 start_codon:yes stop_codon:yes gene_type:complete